MDSIYASLSFSLDVTSVLAELRASGVEWLGIRILEDSGNSTRYTSDSNIVSVPEPTTLLLLSLGLVGLIGYGWRHRR